MSEKISNNKLLKKSKDLENEVLQLRQLATILIDRTDWYQIIFNTCPFGIVITDLEFKLQDANSAFLEMLNYQTLEDLKASGLEELIPAEYRCNDDFRHKFVNDLHQNGLTKVESTFQTRDGSVIPVLLTACVTKDDQGNPQKVAGFVENTSSKIQFIRSLEKKDLEIAALKQTLKEQRNFHKLILRQARKNQKDLEESVILNVKETVIPHLNKLKQSELDELQKEYVDLIKSQLYELISPFYSELSSKHSDLTPMEFRIAGLVRDGKATKDIARLLNISAGTIEFHRNNLRKKLGIRNTNINLRSHLLAMD